MRPQQQNRRMRGRNNNNNNNQNRKGPNPLTRSYESNGPDVKIRGSAQQIAEKYMQLARDAQSSGDRVMAENYLQHAEHYNRIIAAAQAQMPQQQFSRDMRDDQEDDEDQDGQAPQQPFEAQPQANDGTGPQPEISGIPAEVALNPDASGEQPREVRPQMNGTGHAADGEDGAPRRPRRPRRRGRGGDFANRDAGAEEGSAASEGEAAEPEPAVASEPSDEAA